MTDLEFGNAIRSFSTNPRIIMESYALMKVGREKNESADSIMEHVICNLLLRFYEIHPCAPFPSPNSPGNN